MEEFSRDFIVAVFSLLILGSLLIFGAGQFVDNQQAAIVSSANQTVVLQDGLNGYAGTRDTYLYSYHHTSNFGGELELRSSEVEVYTILARFQIFKSEGGPVPNNAVVQSATLSLYKTSPYDFTYQARRLIKDWSELGATWDSTGQGIGWAGGRVEGSDVLATPDGIASVGWDPGWLNIDVTSGIKAFGAGNPNYGWNIYGTSKGSGSGGSEGNINTKYFYARESSQQEFRPKLTIIYTLSITGDSSEGAPVSQNRTEAQPPIPPLSAPTPTSTPALIPAPTSGTVPASGNVSTVGIAVGEYVSVYSYGATGNLNVRVKPGLTQSILGTQPIGNATGKVIGGPEKVDGYLWWQIDYTTGADGWSIQNYLVRGLFSTPPVGGSTSVTAPPSPAPVPVPTPTPTPSPTSTPAPIPVPPPVISSGTVGWTELANTNIRRVCPLNKPGEYDWNSFCKGVIDAWGGGAVDTLRNRLIIFGGGHSDYAGNEIYAINLLSSTVERITNPSPPNISGYNIYADACPSALADGAPNSRHSYDGVVYIPDLDRLFVFGGSLACKTGNGDNVTWMYDFASGRWLRMNPTGTLPRWDLGIVAAYDANSRKVFIHDNYALFAYDVATNSFTRLTGDSDFIDIHMTATVDPVRKKLIIAGGGWDSRGGVSVYDIRPGSTYTRELWTTTGGNAVVNAASPGLAYDPVSDRMIGWAGGNTVYSLDISTKVWTPITFSGGPGAQGMNGTFGRFDYVSALKAFAVVNHVDRNAFLLRLAGTMGIAATPIPTPTPAPVPAPAPAPIPTPAPAPIPRVPISVEPGVFTAIAAPDKGKGVPGQGMKHVTFAYNPDNGRIYQEGGDFPGPGGEQSYRQDTYSLSLTERLADPTNRNAGWRQEYAYCGPAGKVQPKHPDFVGWTWDSRRHVFWMVPGTMEISNDLCPGETGARVSDPAFLLNHLMTFDPVAREWTDRGANTGLDPVETWQSVYDPISDTIIRFGFNGGSGGVANIYNIAKNSWTRVGLGLNAFGQDIRLNKEGITADLAHRYIYAVDGFHGRLHRFNMDTKRMEDLGGIPGGANMSGSTNDAYVAWNSNDTILYFFRLENSTLYMYHPDTKTWGSPAMITSPVGLHVAMRHAMVFDPANDVLVMMGGVEPVNPYIFLYRYK